MPILHLNGYKIDNPTIPARITREELDNLPKGRSFQSVIPFAPGARLEPLQSGTSTSGSGNGGFAAVAGRAAGKKTVNRLPSPCLLSMASRP